MEILNKILLNKKNHFWLFLIILTALSVLMHLSYQPLCPGHDFHFHFLRFKALMDALLNGSYPNYIDYQAIDGYGYLTRVFYSDFILVPFAIIGNWVGASTGYQLMLFVITMLCGIFTYYAINGVYKNTFAAFVGAILYTFCTYRLLDVYHRSALGEVLSFTFIPLVFLGLYHIIRGDYKKWYILAIGYSLMIFSHIISSVLMLVTIVIFLLIYNKSLRQEPKRLIYLLISSLVTLLLVSYYVLPMLEQLMSSDFYYKTNNTMSLAQDSDFGLNWIFWGLFGGGVQPRQIFVPGIGILITAAVCVRIFVYGKNKSIRSADVLTIVALCYLISISNLVSWSIFPLSLLNFIQIPWRLFVFISFLGAVAGAIYLSQALTSCRRILVASLLLLISTAFFIVSDAELYKGIRCQGDANEVAEYGNKYHMGGLEYIPSKVPSINFIDQRGRDSIQTVSTQTSISNFTRNNNYTIFDVNIVGNELLELPLLYYKGYEAKLDGNNVSVSQSKNGLVQIEPKESGKVVVYYEGTNIQKVSVWISMLGIIALIVYIIIPCDRIKRKNQI